MLASVGRLVVEDRDRPVRVLDDAPKLGAIAVARPDASERWRALEDRVAPGEQRRGPRGPSRSTAGPCWRSSGCGRRAPSRRRRCRPRAGSARPGTAGRRTCPPPGPPGSGDRSGSRASAIHESPPAGIVSGDRGHGSRPEDSGRRAPDEASASGRTIGGPRYPSGGSARAGIVRSRRGSIAEETRLSITIRAVGQAGRRGATRRVPNAATLLARGRRVAAGRDRAAPCTATSRAHGRRDGAIEIAPPSGRPPDPDRGDR